ncbi:MAG: glycine cleavage system protein GcvH [Acholeplasmataceae bacterium]|jgi:glycine cleavage system H protein|nr:glycine cleavage system protein GcvH [Acidaminococcaceae bacterium]NLY84633.1 glycine cleavage system protein GcvH [Acholeplasmataceae bacterium]
MKIPAELLYSKDHEWVKVEDGRAVVGITDFAQDQLGDVVFVEVPEAGAELGVGDGLTTIESVKAVSDVYSPLGGKIAQVNEELGDAPQLINEDPYGKGWIAVLEIADAAELKGLLTAEEYKKFLSEEA